MIRSRSKFIKKSFKILKKNPQSIIFPVLANAYREKKQFKIAEKICLQGLKNHPKSSKGYNSLGRTYFDQGKYKEAQKTFEKALDLEPRNLLTLRFLGKIYIQIKNADMALKIYKMLSLFYPEETGHKEILSQLQNIVAEKYQAFSSQPLHKIAQDLDTKELLERPRIQPLNQNQQNHTLPTHEVLTEMKQPPPPPTSFPITQKEKKDRKIRALKNLMDRLTPSP